MATDAEVKIAFIGDSHTNGYIGNLNPEKQGTMWNDNNYAEQFLDKTETHGVVYAMGGASNRVFVNWAKNVLDKFENLQDIVIQLTYPSRIVIAFDSFRTDLIDCDYLSKVIHRDEYFIRMMDYTLHENVVQSFFKPKPEDWNEFPGIGVSMEDGISQPDMWKEKFWKIKLFFELNTWLEKQDQMMWLYTIDNMCKERNVNLHLFKMKPETYYDFDINYYGKIKGNFNKISASEYFLQNGVNHLDYLLEDTEHYNTEYHKLIAEKYIPYILGDNNEKSMES